MKGTLPGDDCAHRTDSEGGAIKMETIPCGKQLARTPPQAGTTQPFGSRQTADTADVPTETPSADAADCRASKETTIKCTSGVLPSIDSGGHDNSRVSDPAVMMLDFEDLNSDQSTAVKDRQKKNADSHKVINDLQTSCRLEIEQGLLQETLVETDDNRPASESILIPGEHLRAIMRPR